jgi:hypothetical protein
VDFGMRMILKEVSGRDYVYHNSPNPDIDVFVPRPFWHNEDWSESIRDETPDFIKDDVVFAIDKNKVPFYALPRDTPRILLNQFHNASKKFLKLTSANIMLLPKVEKASILAHSWTEYRFEKKDFEHLPTDEWISRKAVKPIGKTSYKDPISFLKKSGYKVIWVDDLSKIASLLINKDLPFDAENI